MAYSWNERIIIIPLAFCQKSNSLIMDKMHVKLFYNFAHHHLISLLISPQLLRKKREETWTNKALGLEPVAGSFLLSHTTQNPSIDLAFSPVLFLSSRYLVGIVSFFVNTACPGLHSGFVWLTFFQNKNTKFTSWNYTHENFDAIRIQRRIPASFLVKLL